MAIVWRIPVRGMSTKEPPATGAATVAATGEADATSWAMIRPPGPDPWPTNERSIPLEEAKALAKGLAKILPPAGAPPENATCWGALWGAEAGACWEGDAGAESAAGLAEDSEGTKSLNAAISSWLETMIHRS